MIRVRHLLKYLSLTVFVILALNPMVTGWARILIRAYPLSNWWLLGGMSESLVEIDTWIMTETGGVLVSHLITLCSVSVLYQIVRLLTEEWYYTSLDEDLSAEKIGALVLKYCLVIIPLIVLNPLFSWFLTRFLFITFIETHFCHPHKLEWLADVAGLFSLLAMVSTTITFIDKYLEELTFPIIKL